VEGALLVVTFERRSQTASVELKQDVEIMPIFSCAVGCVSPLGEGSFLPIPASTHFPGQTNQFPPIVCHQKRNQQAHFQVFASCISIATTVWKRFGHLLHRTEDPGKGCVPGLIPRRVFGTLDVRVCDRLFVVRLDQSALRKRRVGEMLSIDDCSTHGWSGLTISYLMMPATLVIAIAPAVGAA
jgi:hypothetical protein